MIIKVCGMREPQNIREVAALAINWIGFIFYERSKRFVERCPTEQQVTDSEQLSPKKVGVFVNAGRLPHLAKKGLFLDQGFPHRYERGLRKNKGV